MFIIALLFKFNSLGFHIWISKGDWDVIFNHKLKDDFFKQFCAIDANTVATELPAVVSAFDTGNLKAVAKALHEKYPHTPIIIAADDDRHLELTKVLLG